MDTNKKFYNRISELIADNRVGTAFDLLEAELPRLQRGRHEFYHAALLLLQKHNDLQQRRINGLLVASEEQQELTLRLLELSDKLDKAASRESASPTAQTVTADPLETIYSPPRPNRIVSEPAQRPMATPPQKGASFGKVALYTLAGIGILFVIAIIIETSSGDYDDFEYPEEDSAVYNPGDNFTPPPPPVQSTELKPLHELLLANTQWTSSIYQYQVRFDAAGNQGVLYGSDGKGTFQINGKDAQGNLMGNFDLGAQGTGEFAIVPPHDADQIMVYSKASYATTWTSQDIWVKNY